MLTLIATLLTAAPSGPATLTIDVKPPETVIYFDGKRRGTAAKPMNIKTPAGLHVVKIVYKGDSYEEQLDLKKGEKKTWKWEFDHTGASKPAPKAEPKEEAKPEQKPDSDLPANP